ncbi:MAG: methyltransferase domain-containing protein [Gammaproteobacteria bacterium]|nr:methyltransferase domain-containing protein [Gammaproteobacteria bacterium]MBU0884929.1 methyltransferase domain-containing protein [Gammaproteobacteria bacterium]MBU1859549.1 methyltransferase domain-containing protein [Gammaproteobacteria bacterium]
MTQALCRVCASPAMHTLYEMQSGYALTSLGQVYPGATRVWVCHGCAHLQTDEIANVAEYYDQHYNILVESEEDDQIYEVRDGQPVYRTAHQVAVLQAKLQLPQGARLLDYGCAKSSTMQGLLKVRPDLQPHLFDVSERYRAFWANFVRPEQCAVYQPRPEWAGSFDVVTSFFSLEHIVAPLDSLQRIRQLIRPDGLFYCIVPNVQSNIADFIVVDHVNHFTRSSLACLLGLAGFVVVEIDAESHRGAFVVVALRSDDAVHSPVLADTEVADTQVELTRIAAFWQTAAQRTRSYLKELPADAQCAIYGAGFYGAFIATRLSLPEQALCFVDQNPHLQGRQLNGRPIVSPAALPDSVDTLLVGLNPAHARQIVADIPALRDRPLRHFYL